MVREVVEVEVTPRLTLTPNSQADRVRVEPMDLQLIRWVWAAMGQTVVLEAVEVVSVMSKVNRDFREVVEPVVAVMVVQEV